MAGITDLVANVPYSFKAGPFGSSLKKDCYVPAGYKVYGQEQVIRGDATFGDYYIGQENTANLRVAKCGLAMCWLAWSGRMGRP